MPEMSSKDYSASVGKGKKQSSNHQRLAANNNRQSKYAVAVLAICFVAFGWKQWKLSAAVVFTTPQQDDSPTIRVKPAFSSSSSSSSITPSKSSLASSTLKNKATPMFQPAQTKKKKKKKEDEKTLSLKQTNDDTNSPPTVLKEATSTTTTTRATAKPPLLSSIFQGKKNNEEVTSALSKAYPALVVTPTTTTTTTSRAAVNTSSSTTIHKQQDDNDNNDHNIPLYIRQIIQNRGLTNPNHRTVRLLYEILQNDDAHPYHPTNDILVFEHALKTGGTSFSLLLRGNKRFFHNQGVVPGSHWSLPFQDKDYWDFITKDWKPSKEDLVLAAQNYSSTTSNNNSSTATPPLLKPKWKTSRFATTTVEMAAAVGKYWQNNAKVVFSHGMINWHSQMKDGVRGRPRTFDYRHGPSKFEVFLQEQLNATTAMGFKRKRNFRVLTMIRDPVPFVASNMAEWMCQAKFKLGLAMELGYHNGTLDLQRDLYKNKSTTTFNATEQQVVERTEPCYGFTLQELHDIWIQHAVIPVCANATKLGLTTFPKTKCVRPAHCEEFQRGQEEPQAYCKSAKKMLNTPDMFLHIHDSQRGYIPLNVYLKYRNYFLGNDNNEKTSTTDKMNQPQKEAEDTELAMIIQDYEYEAMKRLGGLTAQHQSYMMWFGIADQRMEESMCLFHFMTGATFPKQIPEYRKKSCRPISYWNENDINTLRQREGLGYAVSRVAHAILDARLAKMCHLLQRAAADTNNTEYDLLKLPVDSCCANFKIDPVTGGLLDHVPSKID